MTRFAVFAILALLATSVSGAYPSVSTSVFNSTPVTVFDISVSTDTTFNATNGSVVYGPGATNDTAYIWIANYSVAANSIPVIKRTLNATAVGEGASTGLTTADTTITTTVQSEVGILNTITGLGYFAFLTVNDTTSDGIDQLSITIVSTSATTYKLTSNTDGNLTYGVASTWLEDGYFYIVFIQKNATSTLYQSLWAQAIAYNGTTLYSTPQNIATINGTTAYASAGPVNSTNSSSFLVVYKDDTNVVSVVSVTTSTGAAGSATTLKTDGGNITYFPAGTIGSWVTYGALVQVNDNSTGTIAYSVIAYYNGTYTNSTSYAAPSGYMTGSGTGRNFVDGYGVMWTWIDSTTSNGDWENIWTTYYANGTVNTTITIGNFNYPPSVYVDLNGTMWMGYTSVNYTNTDAPLLKGYLGKLVGQVMGANVLASVFAFLSLLIAALFAF
jgi:hypothetical protein